MSVGVSIDYLLLKYGQNESHMMNADARGSHGKKY